LVFLIGCDHCKAQTYAEGSGLDDPQNKTRREFRDVLIKAINDYDPDLIAEEHHPFYLKQHQRRSVVLEVASESRICHRFCDLSPEERMNHGIGFDLPFLDHPQCGNVVQVPDHLGTISDCEWHKHDIAHRFPIREEFWIKQLGNDIHKKVIFVCGALHTSTFSKKLIEREIDMKIIQDEVGCLTTLHGSDKYKALQFVLKNGFPPICVGADPKCFCIGLQKAKTPLFQYR